MCRIFEAFTKRSKHYPFPRREFEIGRIVGGQAVGTICRHLNLFKMRATVSGDTPMYSPISPWVSEMRIQVLRSVCRLPAGHSSTRRASFAGNA